MLWNKKLKDSAATVIISAFILYAVIAIIYFGFPVLLHPEEYYSGSQNDPISFIWFIKWWEQAILHMRNPFLTKVIWYPYGVNLAQSTSVPLIGILGLPITYYFGPTVTYNLFSIFALTLSAFSAFILCKSITNSFTSSLIGGYLFGFSSYQLSQALGHLNLMFTFFIPLLVLTIYLFVTDNISNRRFIVFFSLLLVLQFLISTEIFVTFIFFGVVAAIISYFLYKNERVKLFKLLKCSIVALIVTSVILSPYLYYFFRYPLTKYGNSPFMYSNDLLNFFIPTQITFINTDFWKILAAHFPGNGGAETGAYFGIPWLILLGLFFKEFWQTKFGKILFLMFIVIALVSLGPVLHIAGFKVASMPWMFVSWLPIFGNALADRFIMYAFLLAAIATALWIAHSKKKKILKILLVAFSILFVLPSMLPKYRPWYSQIPADRFILSGEYRHWIKPNSVVMVIPPGHSGYPTMYWQQKTNFYYRTTGGYVGEIPIKADTPFTFKLRVNDYDAMNLAELKEFLLKTHANYILMDNNAFQSHLSYLIKSLPYPIFHIDDVYLVKLS